MKAIFTAEGLGLVFLGFLYMMFIGVFVLSVHSALEIRKISEQITPEAAHQHDLYVHLVFEKAWHDVDIENVSETFTEDGAPYWRVTLPLRNQEGDWLF